MNFDLIVNTAPGCKRLIFDPDYLSNLHKPNIEITFEGVDRIVENGIYTKNGQFFDLDVIIFATGYRVVRSESIVFFVFPRTNANVDGI